MTRRVAAVSVALGLALAAAACGDGAAGPPRAAPPAPAAPTRAPVPRVAAPASDDRIDGLFDAWTVASDTDGAARHRVEDDIVAAGAPALERLLSWLGGDDEKRRDAAFELIPLFGDAAVESLLGLVRGADAKARHGAMGVLEIAPTIWNAGPRGEAVCRALLERVADEADAGRALAALKASRPAGHCVAAEIARLWLVSSGSRSDDLKRVLEELGTDAGPAAPVIVAAWKASARTGDEPGDPTRDREGIYEVLSAIGAAEPSVLDDLRAILRSGRRDDQRMVLRLLDEWGDDAAPVTPELLAVFGDPTTDAELRATVAARLARRRAVPEGAWRPFLDAAAAPSDEAARATETDEAYCARDSAAGVLRALALDPSVAAQIVAAFPSLPAPSMETAFGAIAECEDADLSPLVSLLLARREPSLRGLALRAWARGGAARAAAPESVVALLDDGDPDVRAAALGTLSAPGAAPAERLREAAVALLRTGSVEQRKAAVDALGTLAAADAQALAALVAALDDAGVCGDATIALAKLDAPIAGEHAAALRWASENLFAYNRGAHVGTVLLRMEGGTEALAAALAPAIAGSDVDSNHFHEAMRLVALAGPRLASLRPVLLRARDSATDDGRRERLDEAIALTGDDPEAIALSAGWEEATIRRLLEYGEAGRAAIVLAGGGDRAWWAGDPFDLARAVPLRDAITAASRAASPDPHAERRRRGAAALAPLLATREALAILDALTKDPADGVRASVVASLDRIEDSTPGTVTAALVAPLLADGSADIRRSAVRLAGRLGPRGAELVPALRRFRDDAASPSRTDAAVAIWRITRDADEALPVLRRALANADRDAGWWTDWDGVAAALRELPLTKGDVPAVLTAAREWGPQVPSMIRVLARFGPDAAPAVPLLRELLVDPGVEVEVRFGDWLTEEGFTDPIGRAAADTLAAIGAAARPAVPDLRWRMSRAGDHGGRLSAAIRAIEASPR